MEGEIKMIIVLCVWSLAYIKRSWLYLNVVCVMLDIETQGLLYSRHLPDCLGEISAKDTV